MVLRFSNSSWSIKLNITTASFFAVIISVLSMVAIPAAAKAGDKPNILFIMIDDLNDWVGVMNAHPNALTPNIDQLAERGMLFTNAHAASPICGPARAAILSGKHPSSTGVYGHANFPRLIQNPIMANVTMLPTYFANHGYKTMATGKVFHSGSPIEVFEVVGETRHEVGPRPDSRFEYTPPEGLTTSTDWGPYPEIDQRMPDYRYARWAEEQLMQEHDRPFFMAVGFFRPHAPWYVPQRWFDKHPIDGIRLPHHNESQFEDMPETAFRFSELPQMPTMEWMLQDGRWERSVQGYLASTSFVDYCIGIVLDALEASPHAENTIVVLVSDHGYHLGSKGIWAKHTLWEESTRVPLIIWRPSNMLPMRTHRPVNHIDLYPTFLELANLPPNPDNEGKSLVPLLDNPNAPGFYASLTTHGFRNHSIRTERWRLIQYEDGSEELYDHWSDPHEWRNLATLEQFEPVLEELRGFMPKHNELWDENYPGGGNYNDFLRDVYERNRTRRNE